MAGELAPYRDGIPTVADATTRDALFPLATRAQGQRVYRLDTGTTERWSGSAWVDVLQPALPGQGRTVATLSAYLANNAVANVLDYAPVGVVINTGANSAASAFQAAVNSGRKYVVVPDGSYLIDTEVTGVSNVTIIASGNATILVRNRIRSAFYFGSQSNVTLAGLTFDLGQSVTATYQSTDFQNYYNVGAYFNSTTNITITDIRSSNLYTCVFKFYGSSNIRISRCYMTSPRQTQQSVMEHLNFQTCSNITVQDIQVDNAAENGAPLSPAVVPCGIFAGGTTGKFVVERALFNYCGRDNTGSHRLGVIDFYGDSINVTLRSIRSMNQMAEFTRLACVAHVLVDDVKISYANGAEIGQQAISLESTTIYSGTGQFGTQDVTFRNIEIEDLYDTTRPGIAINSYDWAVPCTDILVDDLRTNQLRTAVVIAGPYRNVKLTNINPKGGTGGRIQLLAVPQGAGVQTTTVTEANSSYEGLVIDGVAAVLDANNITTVDIDFTKTPAYTGTVGLVEIRNVRLKTLGAQNTAQAIAVNGVAGGAQGRVVIRHCDVENYVYAFYLRNHKEVTLERNHTRTIGTASVLQSGNGVLRQSGNTWSAGPSAGTATLVAGTVTVNTAEVLAGDTIRMTRQATGGTVGHLSIGTITAGTSFVINSSSATDTSTILWEIVH